MWPSIIDTVMYCFVRVKVKGKYIVLVSNHSIYRCSVASQPYFSLFPVGVRRKQNMDCETITGGGETVAWNTD